MILLIGTSSSFAQSLDDDWNLVEKQIQEESLDQHTNHNHQPSFLLSEHPSALARYNPFTLSFGSLLWGYQALISPQLSATCIYSPSCSACSKNLLQEYGVLKGIVFTADRISRCNRLALYDYPPWEIDHQIHRVIEHIEYYQIK